MVRHVMLRVHHLVLHHHSRRRVLHSHPLLLLLLLLLHPLLMVLAHIATVRCLHRHPLLDLSPLYHSGICRIVERKVERERAKEGNKVLWERDIKSEPVDLDFHIVYNDIGF